MARRKKRDNYLTTTVHHHGFFWWLLIGWWWRPIQLILWTLLAAILGCGLKQKTVY